jgi:hypothetical protein
VVPYNENITMLSEPFLTGVLPLSVLGHYERVGETCLPTGKI